jgi:hypothetical protein
MCDVKIIYQIPRGYSYRPFEVKCGNTDPQGDLALCPSCEDQRRDREAVTDYCAAMGFDM